MAESETDRLIRDLIETNRLAKDHELKSVIAHIAQASFSKRYIGVAPEIRGKTFYGQELKDFAQSDIAHLAKRVLVEGQWSLNTTLEDYLHDINIAVRHQVARLVVYTSRGRNCVGILSPNEVPHNRLGDNSLPWLWIVYDADHGIIVTGYQVAGIEKVRIPGEARWLK